jgi:hypothetical protein
MTPLSMRCAALTQLLAWGGYCWSSDVVQEIESATVLVGLFVRFVVLRAEAVGHLRERVEVGPYLEVLVSTHHLLEGCLSRLGSRYDPGQGRTIGTDEEAMLNSP